MQDDSTDARIGASYAAFQLAKALTTRRTHGNRDVRARASARIARWLSVLKHAWRGTANYGSRTPFSDIPAWVTLEVAQGGFATGGLLAGGDLMPHEIQLAASIAGVRKGHERLDLNHYFLSDDGIADLQQRLARGDYAVHVPEEAVLLTVAWLLDRGHQTRARTLVETIAPFLHRLRFFPAPTTVSQSRNEFIQVQVASAGEVAAVLSTLEFPLDMAVQRYVVTHWLPWYDDAVSLLLETCEDDWPCRSYPDGWRERAAAHCRRFDEIRRTGSDPGKKRRIEELRGLIDRCVRSPTHMSGREVSRARQIVGDFVRCYGLPDSTLHRERRGRQRRETEVPGHYVFGQIVAARLAACPSDDGVSDPDGLSYAITADEAQQYPVAAGAAIPRPILRRLRRCRSGSLAQLVEQGLVTSGDAIARLIPQYSAAARAAAFADEALRALYAATYRAFRRRRSLLLLNLQHQVRFSELPWITAIASERHSDAATNATALAVLRDSAALVLEAFPHAIVPNKLLQEFRALAEAAGLDLPFLDELAADIFMGRFSPKFVRAAKNAADVLRDSLYARYYVLDTEEMRHLPTPPAARTSTSGVDFAPERTARKDDPLAVLCARRAGVGLGTWRPAINGMIIEQQQIITTHNLIALFHDLGLRERLKAKFPEMIMATFGWICARLRMKCCDRHAQLVTIKNAAYAWRQLVFYVSMLDASACRTTLAALQEHLDAQPPDFVQRFSPALRGLQSAANGRAPRADTESEHGRLFLGWSAQPHWLLVSV
jgi:hypothetical protein